MTSILSSLFLVAVFVIVLFRLWRVERQVQELTRALVNSHESSQAAILSVASLGGDAYGALASVQARVLDNIATVLEQGSPVPAAYVLAPAHYLATLYKGQARSLLQEARKELQQVMAGHATKEGT
jgi:hypothetical protein